MTKLQKIYPFIIIFLFTLPVVLPYFHHGFFPTHDGEWTVVRLADMYREVRDMQIPPRFSGNLNFGYGYPLFNFAYPLPYYLGLPLFLMGIGLVNSIKILFALSVPLSALFIYLAGKELWKSVGGGIISAFLYIYLPYRMVDLYVRGSLGESIASILFPLILFIITRIMTSKQHFAWVGVLAVTFAMLVLTHNIMAVLFSLILMPFLLFLLCTQDRKRAVDAGMGIVLGIVLSAYFWLPALVEKQYIFLSKVPIADRDLYYVTIQQLLFSPWGYGTPTESNPFTYQIGLAHIALVLITVSLVVWSYITKKMTLSYQQKMLTLFASIVVGMFLMMFPFSSFIWEKTPLLREINYPWTLLLPVGFLASLIAGYTWRDSTLQKIVVGLLTILAIIFVLPNAKPSQYVDRGDGFYFTNDATTTSSREYTPLWVKELPEKRASQKVEIIDGEGDITNILSSSDETSFFTTLRTDVTVQVNTIYYPGWRAYVDYKEVKIFYNNERGVMQLQLDKGRHNVRFYFQETPLRLLANVLSLMALLPIAYMLVKNKFFSGRTASNRE